MDEFDLFDMLGIAFDPPETKGIDKKIEKKKKELGSELQRATQDVDKVRINRTMKFLDEMSALLLSDNGKLKNNKDFTALAEKKKNQELSNLKATVNLLSLTGERTVTGLMLKDQRKRSRLSENSIKQVFTDAGFTFVDKDPLESYPKFPVNADRTYSELEILRKTENLDPNAPDSSNVNDLYSFAAYLSNDMPNESMYKAMDIKELCEIFDSAAKRLSKRNDDFGKILASLSTSAKTYVFNSEENREAYERYLKYRSRELRELFETMKRVPEVTLLEPKFADACIKKISEYFPEYETALAIYNKEAGFKTSYYCPVNWKYTVKCNDCGTVNEFESEAEAIRINSCRNCRKKLFKKCDKCGRPVLISADKCPHCNYVFASAALFARYYQQAEEELRKNNFNVARKQLFQAQSAAPAEKTRIDQLSAKIDAKEKELQKPIDLLNGLINNNKYQTARKELGTIVKEHPSLNITEFKRKIEEELSEVDKLFSAAQNYSSSKKADACISILMKCSDYSPALSYLGSTPPLPCGSIVLSPVSNKGVINVSWSRSTEQGISYRLVRKIGKVAATSENDGDILLRESSSTSYVDDKVKAGVIYTYSVFTIRKDVYSSATSRTTVLYTDVKNLSISQHNGKVRISWDSPSTSRGATVVRYCDGNAVILSQTAKENFEDSDTQYGKTYSYRVYANYEGNNRSSGIDSDLITIHKTISSFSIQVSQVKANEYDVSWSIRDRGIDLRIMVNGNQVSSARSEDMKAQISLPLNAYCVITVNAFSGGKWLRSDNSVEVNTYTSCAIDKKSTQLEERMISGQKGVSYQIDMKIRLSGPIPDSVSAFYYTVRTTKSDSRWANVNDIRNSGDIGKMTRTAYQDRGYLLYQDTVRNETTFYVTVFTCHQAGSKEIISDPQKVKIERRLNANLFWSVTNKLFEGLKLHVELSGNRPIDYVPAICLCISEKNYIISKDDRNSEIIMMIPSVELDETIGEYNMTYDIRTRRPLKNLKKYKFFLFAEDINVGDNITVRPKQGFSGKV